MECHGMHWNIKKLPWNAMQWNAMQCNTDITWRYRLSQPFHSLGSRPPRFGSDLEGSALLDASEHREVRRDRLQHQLASQPESGQSGAGRGAFPMDDCDARHVGSTRGVGRVMERSIENSEEIVSSTSSRVIPIAARVCREST